MPPRRCSTPWCPNPAQRGGLCREHRNARDRARNANPSRIYTLPRWRKLRARVLQAEPNCRRCGQPATVVDHELAIEDGGAPWDADNLQALCAQCHNTKSRNEQLQRARGQGPKLA